MITIQALPRQARERHEGRIVGDRELEALELVGEEVAEFEYRLVACREAYRPHFLSRAVVARPPGGRIQTMAVLGKGDSFGDPSVPAIAWSRPFILYAARS